MKAGLVRVLMAPQTVWCHWTVLMEVSLALVCLALFSQTQWWADTHTFAHLTVLSFVIYKVIQLMAEGGSVKSVSIYKTWIKISFCVCRYWWVCVRASVCLIACGVLWAILWDSIKSGACYWVVGRDRERNFFERNWVRFPINLLLWMRLHRRNGTLLFLLFWGERETRT